MTQEIKVCVDSRVNFLDDYFIIPQELQKEIDTLKKEITGLGERCGGAEEFEDKFVSTGLSERFAAIIPRCTPKPHKMTKDEKKKSLDTAKEMLRENKQDIAKGALDSIAVSARVSLSGEAAERIHNQRIADGTAADITIAKNRITDAGRLLGFLVGKFGKK